MLKIMQAGASAANGLVQLSPTQFLFHNIHSKTLAILAGLEGCNSVPLPLLFKKYFNDSTTSMPLHHQQDPTISMIRLIVSPYPYSLRSTLLVGFTQPNGVLVVFRNPVITSADFENTHIKVPSTLMICSSPSMEDATPLSEEVSSKIIFTDKIKRVLIDETKNSCLEFDATVPISNKNKKATKSCESKQSPKSILKWAVNNSLINRKSETYLHAQIFYAIFSHSLQIGQCPAVPFNTVFIMSRSQNSLCLVPEAKLSSLQNLFVKHVLLHRMGLENTICNFEALYNPHIQEINSEEEAAFDVIMDKVKTRTEDIIFCLNTISQNVFSRPVKYTSAPQQIKLAMEKYFLMFPPTDKENTINFSMGIVDIICKGTEFKTIIGFLSRYMEIQENAPEKNLIKFYALLTV